MKVEIQLLKKLSYWINMNVFFNLWKIKKFNYTQFVKQFKIEFIKGFVLKKYYYHSIYFTL